MGGETTGSRKAESVSEEVDRVEELLRGAAESGEGAGAPELLHELGRLPERDARGVLDRVAKSKSVGAVSLLLKLASEETPLAVAAVEALGTVRDRAAASALQTLASEDRSGDVRKAARRALHRLASQGITPSPAAAASEEQRRAALPVVSSIGSPIDGGGNRVLWFGFGRGGEIDMLGLVLNDLLGIVDLVSSDVTRTRFDRELSKLLHDERLPWVEMPFDYCRFLVEESHARNAASGTRLPLEYLTWRERIGKPEQEYLRPLVYTVLNSAEVRWDPRYLDRSAELFDLEMFRMWALDRHGLEEFVRERTTAQRSGLVLPGVNPEARDRSLMDRAIQRLFDPERRALYKRRLEEMAYLLWKLEYVDRARMALAAALAFEPPDRSLLDHPFVRQLVEWSVEIASTELEGERARTVRPGVQLHLPY